MEKEIKDLLDHERYADLNSDEKAQLSELCSGEEDFVSLKELFTGIEGIRSEKLNPAARTKRSLDELFDETYGSKKKLIWYNTTLTALYPKDRPVHRRPLIQIAAALVLVLLTIPILNKVDVTSDKQLVASRLTEKENDGSVPAVQDKTEVNNAPAAELKASEQTVMRSAHEESASPVEAEEIVTLTADHDFSAVSGSAAAAPAVATAEDIFDHPDGIFTGASADVSRSARKQLKALDLLTPTF